MRASATALVLAGLALVLALPAQAQRGGGSHGGFSGRGGFSRGPGGGKGPSMSAARAGRHFRGAGPPPRMLGRVSSSPVVVLRGSPVQSPVHRVVLRRPIGFVRPVPVHPVFAHRFRFHRFHPGFGFPFCSPFFGFGFATHHFGFFGRELECFPRPFFGPFFFPFAPVVSVTFLTVPSTVVFADGPLLAGQQMEEASAKGYYGGTYQLPAESQPAGQPPASSQQAVRLPTLLQLKNGLMYGLTDYWLEDGRLHYITSYGAENSVPLEEIDFDKTVQLNWERGVEFILRPKPATR